jgi:hypothetical protein
MNVNLEQIDMLRQRANVSYEEAKDAMERCGGDMVEALIYLEKQNRVRGGNFNNTNTVDGFVDTMKKLFRQGMETRFVIKKEENNVINVPVNAVLLTTVIVPPVTIIGGLAALFTNHKMRIEKPDGSDSDINKSFDQLSGVANDVKDRINKL